MNTVIRFKDWLNFQNTKSSVTATDEDVISFENEKHVILPKDLTEYFKIFNGTAGQYDDKWFCFYSLKEFQNLERKFAAWRGTPDYRNIVNTLENHQSCYVFADYQCHLFAYAIRLQKNAAIKNEVYAICGDEFRIIADSFTEFVVKYLYNPDDLQF